MSDGVSDAGGVLARLSGMGRQRTYPSDLTDAEWEIIEPMLPLIKEPGRPPKHPFPDIVDAIRYVNRTGCS